LNLELKNSYFIGFTVGGELIRSYNLPVGAHLMVENGEKIKAGKVLVKIPRRSSKSGDIGGLPRITELLEARNPSNPAVVSEIDGVVSFGKEVTVRLLSNLNLVTKILG
jgi:hypothetical protein